MPESPQSHICEALQLLRFARPADAESRELVRAVISELNASSMKDMGRVMKEVQSRAQGRGDGKLLSDIVRSSLS